MNACMQETLLHVINTSGFFKLPSVVCPLQSCIRNNIIFLIKTKAKSASLPDRISRESERERFIVKRYISFPQAGVSCPRPGTKSTCTKRCCESMPAARLGVTPAPDQYSALQKSVVAPFGNPLATASRPNFILNIFM